MRSGDFTVLRYFQCSKWLAPLYASWRRLIDNCPEDSELLDGVDKLVEVDWFYYIGVHAKLIARHHISFLTRRGEDYHWNHSQFLIRLDLLQDLQSIDLGQLEVKE